jgi:hypothetical protein
MTTLNTFARKAVLIAGLVALLPAWAAVDIKGAKFADTYQLGNQSLSLNGAGVRVKLIVDVYAAGLYVPKKEHAVAALLSEAGPKSMQIVLLRNLTGETFADAMVAGFKKNNSEADVAKFQAKMEEIRNMMLTFGEVKKGTVIHIDHLPGAGTHVLVDGVQKGGEIVGDDFFAALLKIWLGPSPVDSDLKEALLGTQ